MDEALRAYVDAIPSEHRPLFDRIHRLVLEAHPDAELALSYRMPTYRVGRRRLYVGVWSHGVSLYGWKKGGDGGFAARHPELVVAKATIHVRPDDAAHLDDDELRELVRGALSD